MVLRIKGFFVLGVRRILPVFFILGLIGVLQKSTVVHFSCAHVHSGNSPVEHVNILSFERFLAFSLTAGNLDKYRRKAVPLLPTSGVS